MSTHDDRSGTTLGPYAIEELLGRGGMGQVYRATDVRKGRIVALKLLHADLADNTNFRDRFLRESRVAARLNDPHVVPIHDYGEIDGLLYIDMRLVSGRDLRALLTEAGPLDPQRALDILGQVADALDTAHESGLAHRDVNPDNVLADARDFTYLADFGLAQADTDTRLTSVGQAIGSFGYMAPERFGTDETGAPGDIYALGCVLYECLTGAQPFASATTIEQLISAHLNSPPPAIGSPLDPVIARAMAKAPQSRYATAGEFIAGAKAAYTPGQTLAAPPTLNPSPVGYNPSSGPTFMGYSPVPAPHRPSEPSYHPNAPIPTGQFPSAQNTRAQNPSAQSPYPGSYPRTVAAPGYQYPAAPQRSRLSGVGVMLIVVAVFLVACIGVGSWLLLRDNSNAGGNGTQAAGSATQHTTAATAHTDTDTATTTAPTSTLTTTVPARRRGDLGLPTPISSPACDGTGIVIVENAVTPGRYATDVASYLAQYPGSSYLRSDASCGSLRDRDDHGNVIYAVYQVAGKTFADICRLRSQLGGRAYGKWLDNTTDPNTFISGSQCGA